MSLANSLSCALESSMKMWQVRLRALQQVLHNVCAKSCSLPCSLPMEECLVICLQRMTVVWGLLWTTAGWNSQGLTVFPKVRRYPAAGLATSEIHNLWVYLCACVRVLAEKKWSLPPVGADERSLSGSSASGSRTPSPFGGFSPSSSSSASSSTVPETYSRKVFVGGLPPDIDQGQSRVERATCMHILARVEAVTTT